MILRVNVHSLPKPQIPNPPEPVKILEEKYWKQKTKKIKDSYRISKKDKYEM